MIAVSIRGLYAAFKANGTGAACGSGLECDNMDVARRNEYSKWRGKF